MGDLIEQRMGVRISPHLFRDALATFLADHHRDCFEPVMKILHHANESTGAVYRAHSRQLAVQTAWEEVLADYGEWGRDNSLSRVPPRRRR